MVKGVVLLWVCMGYSEHPWVCGGVAQFCIQNYYLHTIFTPRNPSTRVSCKGGVGLAIVMVFVPIIVEACPIVGEQATLERQIRENTTITHF
jgi:hypothetical protein